MGTEKPPFGRYERMLVDAFMEEVAPVVGSPSGELHPATVAGALQGAVGGVVRRAFADCGEHGLVRDSDGNRRWVELAGYVAGLEGLAREVVKAIGDRWWEQLQAVSVDLDDEAYSNECKRLEQERDGAIAQFGADMARRVAEMIDGIIGEDTCRQETEWRIHAEWRESSGITMPAWLADMLAPSPGGSEGC